MNNAINWFEIPVGNIDRAAEFYESLLAIRLKREIFGGMPNAIFASDARGVGGALVQDARRAPASNGTMVYLDATGKLDACLDRVSSAGGSVVLPKTDIGDPGFIALVRDPDGNCVGLHSPR